MQRAFEHPASFHPHIQTLSLLPSVDYGVFNDVKLNASIQTLEAWLPAMNPASAYTMNVKAHAHFQTQQIDSAIKLLKMQYDSIMLSVKSTGQLPSGSGATQQSLSSTVDFPEQASFAVQFSLPGEESRIEYSRLSSSHETVNSKKRSAQELTVEITAQRENVVSIENLVSNSESLEIKNPEQSSQAKKRPRRP